MLRTLRALGVTASVFIALGAGFPVDGVYGSGRGCEMYSVWGATAVTEGIPIFEPGSPAGEELLKRIFDESKRAISQEKYDPSLVPQLLTDRGLFTPGSNCAPIASEGDRITLECYDLFGDKDIRQATIRITGDKVTLGFRNEGPFTFTRCPEPE